MVLVHSKQKTPIEIERFVATWVGDTPLVVVPTAYPQLTEARIKEIGRIGMVIYGNHSIRATIKAMRDVFAEIRPVTAMVEVSALLDPRMLVEIEADAYVER